MKQKTTAILLAACFATVSNASAQSLWNGGVGDYNDPDNWTPSGVPGAGTAIEIDSGTATRTGVDSLYERAADSVIDGGNLVLENMRFLNARGGPATFDMLSGSLTQNNSTYFIVGQNNAGVFNQSGGDVTANISRGFFISDGGGSSSNYTLSGGTLNVNMSGSYNTDLHNVQLGRGSGGGGAVDLLHVDGGSMNITNTNPDPTDRRFYIRRDSTFMVGSGAAVIDNFRFFIVGRDTYAGTTANAVFSGGSTTINVRDAYVMGGGGDAFTSVSGGTLDITKVGASGGNLWLNDGGNTLSAVFQQSGGTVTVEGDIILGRNATGSARYLMEGGTLFANDILPGSGLDAEFQYLDGQVFLSGDRTSILGESWFVASPGTFAIYDGGLDRTLIIPEPSTAVLAALALGGLALRRRRD